MAWEGNGGKMNLLRVLVSLGNRKGDVTLRLNTVRAGEAEEQDGHRGQQQLTKPCGRTDSRAQGLWHTNGRRV